MPCGADRRSARRGRWSSAGSASDRPRCWSRDRAGRARGRTFIWVRLATPSRLVRAPGPSRVVEDEPFPLRIRAVGRRLPPPAGELTDPALDAPIAIGPRWRGRLEHEVRCGQGRRRMGPARLVVSDPLGCARASPSPTRCRAARAAAHRRRPRRRPRSRRRSSVLAGLDGGAGAGTPRRARDRARGRRPARVP